MDAGLCFEGYVTHRNEKECKIHCNACVMLRDDVLQMLEKKMLLDHSHASDIKSQWSRTVRYDNYLPWIVSVLNVQ